MRTLMLVLSTELFGAPVAVPDFPVAKSLWRIGLSDWEGYARLMGERLSYTNTFYHREPRLDITRIRLPLIGRFHFVISSDVFEHVPIGGLDKAFRNAYRLLRPGGFMLLTVPFTQTEATVEHFPELHDFEIRDVEGKKVLFNRTRDGRQQRFDSLVFHGGDGSTLEMRRFGEGDLFKRLRGAGFEDIRICAEDCAASGVMWPSAEHAPIIARRPLRRWQVLFYTCWQALLRTSRQLISPPKASQ